MQKRFCSCGHMLFVRYICANGSWQPLFIVNQHPVTQPKISVSTCPKCGTPINIHSLR